MGKPEILIGATYSQTTLSIVYYYIGFSVQSPLSRFSYPNFLSVFQKVSITLLLGTFLLAGLYCTSSNHYTTVLLCHELLPITADHS